MSKTKKVILISFIIVILMVIMLTLFINLYMINSTKSQIMPLEEIKDINDIDAILVLGCKVENDVPSLMLSRRLEMGVDVYNLLHKKIILSGDHGKKNYDEVNVMRNYILDDVDSNDIFLDHAGFSTYDSIYRAKYIFNAKKIAIVTQKYHMYRALYLANKLDIEAIGIVAEDIPQKIIMFKNEIREILSRDKNFFQGIFKPQSKYLGETISLY